MGRAVIFDVDGTLIDSNDYHARAWQETFARYEIETTVEEVRAQIGKGGDQLLPVFVPKEMIERVGEQMKGERTAYFKEKYLPLVRPFPKVRELFERLKADGVEAVLASSGKEEEVEEYKKIAGIADLLDDHTSSDDAEKSKPHPDIFLAAVEKLGNPDRSRVVVVGDTPYDAEAATKAGLRIVGVLCGGWGADELRKAGCSAVYRDPADLLARYPEWLPG
jgi:HAD superfamily hydrolase (TIGR01509 family)